jgi:hypothetical protein
MSKGVKHDSGKAPLDLIPYEAQVAIAKVLDFGARKYARGNWTNGIEYSRLIAAAQRHIGLYNSGQDLDEESGLNHIAHAGCCLMFLLYMHEHRKDLDDRVFKKQLTKPSLYEETNE